MPRILEGGRSHALRMPQGGMSVYSLAECLQVHRSTISCFVKRHMAIGSVWDCAKVRLTSSDNAAAGPPYWSAGPAEPAAADNWDPRCRHCFGLHSAHISHQMNMYEMNFNAMFEAMEIKHKMLYNWTVEEWRAYACRLPADTSGIHEITNQGLHPSNEMSHSLPTDFWDLTNYLTVIFFIPKKANLHCWDRLLRFFFCLV